jgi:polyhydroxyalkanoate synthesis regulator protein
MYTIKKYANGRFYDTVTKNYITRSQISKLMSSKKEIEIVDTKSGTNITEEIVSQIKAKAAKTTKQKPKTKKAASKKTKAKQDSTSFIVQLFRKGGDTLSDYSKKYASMWQEMLTMSKEEVDKVVNLLVKDNKISEFEAKNLKIEILKYRDSIQSWITNNIDHRINEVLNKMNLANRDQVLDLTAKIKTLNAKISKLEKAKSASEPVKPAAAKKAKK